MTVLKATDYAAVFVFYTDIFGEHGQDALMHKNEKLFIRL